MPQPTDRPRFQDQHSQLHKTLQLTEQQAAQVYSRSANQELPIAEDFELPPLAAYYQQNDVQMKQLDASRAPLNRVDLRGHL